MMKKGIIMASAAITAAGLFGGCANRSRENADSSAAVRSQTVDSREEDNIVQTNADIPDLTRTENIDNLTESTATGVSIDYVIESYENIQKFGYDLFAQVIDDKNPVLSPVSAYLALSMAGCGADGATKDEFYRLLGNDLMTLSDDMMNTFPEEGEVLKLSIANSAWIDDEFIVDDTWLGAIQSLMDAEAVQADLSTEETMSRINHWIDDKTNGLIDKMLSEPLDSQARMALFNTVYFKGKWAVPFKANDTCKEDFYLHEEKAEKEQVDMMNLYMTELEYIANDFAEGVVLPYQKNDNGSGGENLAFIALKPTGGGNVRDVYGKLTNTVLADILDNGQTQLVNLKLPKFEITFDKELNESLSNMGLAECFDEEKANFDRMGKSRSGDNLYISLVRQKAKIIVDEEGTEAAAVTEVIMACGAAIAEPQEPKEIYFNEPFIYMIMDMDKEIPLFVGILDNPVL